MTDFELRFIGALLRANDTTQQEFYRKQVPKSVFVIRTKEYDWVVRYRDKYGRYPSRFAFADKFNVKLPRTKDPVEAAIQPVLDAAMKEQIKNVVGKTKKLIDDDTPVDKVVDYFRSLAAKVTSYSIGYTDINLSESRGALDRYEENVIASLDPNNKTLKSPWPSLNKVIKYFRGGEQIVFSARFGLGKSWIACFWAHYFASRGIRTLVITKEMPGEQFEDRLDCLKHGIDYECFREGNLSPKELRRWRTAKLKKEEYDDYPLVIVGSETLEGVGFGEIISKCEELGPQVVIVDGAYLIRPAELPANTGDVQRFTYLSNRFKALAKYFRALFILTVQDNRTAEDKKGHSKGTATSIYGADAWGQDSDYVLNIGGKRGAGDREISLLKGRESGLVEFMVAFELEPPNFVDRGSPPQKLKKSTVAKHKFIGIK